MHSGSFIISGERNSQVLTRDLTQGGNTMDTIGITVAVIGIIVSTATIVYALWNLFDMLADALDERDRIHRHQWDY